MRPQSIYMDFNPRSPCGERLALSQLSRPEDKFQSTLPVWGATGRDGPVEEGVSISIHAPRVGSDPAGGCRSCPQAISIHAPRVGSDPQAVRRPAGAAGYFNPRSPCGERLWPLGQASQEKLFQSTLPVWGATAYYNGVPIAATLFQSTLPVWGATGGVEDVAVVADISIHAPRVGSDTH